MQLHLLTVKPHDEKGFAVNAHHFAIDGLDTLPHFLIAPHEVGKSALPINTGVMPHAPCCLRGDGDTKAQHETTRDDTDDFRNGYHGTLLG